MSDTGEFICLEEDDDAWTRMVLLGRFVFQVRIIFTGLSQFLKDDPITNLDFKIDGVVHTFTRQLRKNIFNEDVFQGFLYASKVTIPDDVESVKITMPLFVTIPRHSGTKPDMKFYFTKWRDIDCFELERTVELKEDMEPLIVEYQQKAKEEWK